MDVGVCLWDLDQSNVGVGTEFEEHTEFPHPPIVDAFLTALAPTYHPTEDADKPATNADVHRIISSYIREHAGPAIHSEFQRLHTKVDYVKEEIRRLMIRIAWAERDTLNLQTEVAKKQLVIRNWPDDSKEEDRWATVTALCRMAGVDPESTALAPRVI